MGASQTEQPPETPVLAAAPLTAEFLTSRVWRFHHLGGYVATETLRLLPDGRIGGYEHPNERGWCLHDGKLMLLDGAGACTAVMDNATWRDGRVTLWGPHLPTPTLTLCLTEVPQSQGLASSQVLDGPPAAQADAASRRSITTRDVLAKQIALFGWEVGDHSYGLPTIHEAGQAHLAIGKYTSIAGGVQIALGNHRLDTVSSYPFVALRQHWPTAPQGVSDHTSRGDVRIGNDVWLATNVFIASGVTIGDGAAIGAGAVVTRDVPPYAVAAGNPCRVIRHRFDTDTVGALCALAWWNWSDDTVAAYLPLMLSSDIGAFLRAALADPMLG